MVSRSTQADSGLNVPQLSSNMSTAGNAPAPLSAKITKQVQKLDEDSKEVN
jgi:spore maturation protein SpmA